MCQGVDSLGAVLTLETAQSLISAAISEASSRGFKLAFVVVDQGGHVVASARMDGAPWITPDVALGKAWTAAAYGAPSAAQGEKMKELVAFSASITAATGGRFTPQIGGLPIVVDGVAAGGIGASGAAGHEDEAVCRAALESVLG
jgi:glc operon protein GlcG